MSRRKAWHHQNANRIKNQSKRAVWRAKVELRKTREARVVLGFEQFVREIEAQMRRRHQQGLSSVFKSTEVEKVKKVNSQYIQDEQGELL